MLLVLKSNVRLDFEELDTEELEELLEDVELDSVLGLENDEVEWLEADDVDWLLDDDCEDGVELDEDVTEANVEDEELDEESVELLDSSSYHKTDKHPPTAPMAG